MRPGATRRASALYLAYISPTSPLHLPYISPIQERDAEQAREEAEAKDKEALAAAATVSGTECAGEPESDDDEPEREARDLRRARAFALPALLVMTKDDHAVRRAAASAS